MNSAWHILLRILTICIVFVPTLVARGDLYITNYNTGRILRFNSQTGVPLASPTNFDFGGGSADGMSFDILGRLHVATTDSNGVSRIRRFSFDLSGITTISEVSGVNFLDQTQNSTHLFQATFNEIYRANIDGTNFTPLITPGYGTDGIRIGPSGNLYVVNATSGLIDRYDPTTGTLLANFLGSTQVVGIGSQMEFGPDNRVYVSRTIDSEGRVYRYSRIDPNDVNSLLDPNSEELFGSLGGGLATGIRFGPDGRLYANNYGDNSVWRSGVDLSQTGMSVFISSGLGGLDGPGSIIFAAIPEPASFIILLGVIALGGISRRNRNCLKN